MACLVHQMSHPHHRPIWALVLRLASALALATMLMLVKLAAHNGVALPELMFWRQVVTVPLLLGWLAARGRLGTLATRRLRTHARRAMLGMVGMIAVFGAAMLLPLAVSTILNFTTPLFAAILGTVLLGEKAGRWRWLAVLLGFVGVLIIARPGAMPISPLGAAAGLGSGLMVAIVSIQLRDLGRTEAPSATVFYFALFGTMVTAPLLPFVITHHTAQTWAVLICIGLTGTAAQLLLTGALRYGTVASVVVMDYSALIWTTLYGWKVFHQLPPASTWAGAPLIITAGLIITLREHRMARLMAEAAAAEA